MTHVPTAQRRPIARCQSTEDLKKWMQRKEIGSMTDTPESTSERIAVAGQRRGGVNHALAWSGIAAAAVFIVAVVFFSGFFIGRATDGFGGNRGGIVKERPA